MGLEPGIRTFRAAHTIPLFVATECVMLNGHFTTVDELWTKFLTSFVTPLSFIHMYFLDIPNEV
jgi:hypothetical protein